MKKFMFIIITLLALLSGTIISIETASADEVLEYDKMYTSYEIQKGDTLSEICCELYYSDEYVNKFEWESYKDLMDEVIQMNSMKSFDRLYAGNYIVIPYCVESQK